MTEIVCGLNGEIKHLLQTVTSIDFSKAEPVALYAKKWMGRHEMDAVL